MRDAIEEYGNAICQLAAANIFPWDMAFKNSASPSRARSVCDYDEICYMTEVNFRDIRCRYPEDELTANGTASRRRCFPEEFRLVMCRPAYWSAI